MRKRRQTIYSIVGVLVVKDHDGRPILEHARLTGSKFAVRRGGYLYVSPAMMRLIEDCQSPDELCHLLAQIPYRVLSSSSPIPKGRA